jgi:hypothetical protein
MVATTALFHSGDGGDSGFFPQWQQSAKEGLFPQRQWWRHGFFHGGNNQLRKACFHSINGGDTAYFHGSNGGNGFFPWRHWRQWLLSTAAVATTACFHGGNGDNGFCECTYVPLT